MLSGISGFIEVVTVPSAANSRVVADSPSRKADIDSKRRIATHLAFEADVEGQKVGFSKRHPNCGSGVIRHVEGDDDDVMLDCSDDHLQIANQVRPIKHRFQGRKRKS